MKKRKGAGRGKKKQDICSDQMRRANEKWEAGVGMVYEGEG